MCRAGPPPDELEDTKEVSVKAPKPKVVSQVDDPAALAKNASGDVSAKQAAKEPASKEAAGKDTEPWKITMRVPLHCSAGEK